MTITNQSFNVDVLETIRDLLRDDATLLSLLGITSLTAKNVIFAKQPAKQVKGFTNPRIVVYHVSYVPIDIGFNAVGFSQKEVEFQISAWIDNTTGWSDSVAIMERICSLVNDADFTVTGSPTSKGHFKVISGDAGLDPEKENTDFVRVLAQTKTNIGR